MGWRMLLLAPPAFYPPLVTMVWNFGYVTRHYRLVVIGIGFLAVGMLTASLLDRTRYRVVATPLTFLAVCMLSWGGELSAFASPVGMLVLMAVAAGVVWRLRHMGLVSHVISWAALFLSLSLLAASAQVALAWSDHEPGAADHAPAVLDQPTRDVVFVVLDGFPSSGALRDLGKAGIAVGERLEQHGFQVDIDMRASYSLTHAAVPSIVSMSLVMDETDVQTQASRRHLSWIQGGGGRLFETFRRAGYHVTLVESGWAALRCVDSRDTCISRPWIDDGTYNVLRGSVLRPVLDHFVLHDWHLGIQHSMQWIDSELVDLANNETMDFVFLHLILPHPPYVFDRTCNASRAQLEDAFEEQLECTLAVVETIVAEAASSIVVLVGDHGSDVTGQMGIPSETWTQGMVEERMHTLGAVRGTDACAEPFPRVNTNISVYLVRCLGGDVAYMPETAYVAARFENQFREVASGSR